ncbi:TfuA-like protein [Desulfovibrio sp. JC010]|uniref:TfuA-like protein n=1 Tax=Desulfovibrio sp. JC010 TaxID=2593641 RepID=UPI0013D53FAB|nr:TfuA-like protein [Desulfovibrio sp. JC010]NDV27675.1 hypothetical protein [Desulfovibrio sp. JC010]
MKPVIFCGPSLNVQEAAKILDAVYLPPAGQGDILGVIENLKPSAIGLIDGVWDGQVVWYREIMLALDAGIPVYGSSHIGAVRAVELAACGMRGVGRIYETLKEQDFLDYGEAACSWKCDAEQYIRLGEPMVNVRATLAAAVHDGIIDEGNRADMEAAAASIFYQDRTWDRVLHDFARISEAEFSDRFNAWLGQGYVDQQALDALKLVESLRNPLPVEKGTDRQWKGAGLTQCVQDRFTLLPKAKGRVSRSEIVDYAALHHPGFNEINFNALNRKLVMLFAHELGVESDSELESIEEERFRRRRKLNDDQDFAEWMKKNDLTVEQFSEMMAERAVCHQLHRWLMQVKQPASRNTRAVLEELKMRGDYPQIADKVALRNRLIEEKVKLPDKIEQIETGSLFREHLVQTGIPWEYDYRVQIQEYGLSGSSFSMELYKSRFAREYMRELVLGDGKDTGNDS